MSRSDRDQRQRPHSGKRCPESANGGCVWCRTGDQKPLLRRRARHEGKAEARRLAPGRDLRGPASSTDQVVPADSRT